MRRSFQNRLWDCGIGPEGAQAIASVLGKLQRLELVKARVLQVWALFPSSVPAKSLQGNRIGDAGAKFIGKALSSGSHTLLEL